jgi:magnesium-transporting ATPase (P-type)
LTKGILKCRFTIRLSPCKRDGKWENPKASELVPGDVIRLRLGDIVPADARLLDGDSIEVNQSAVTGEYLPVTVKGADGKLFFVAKGALQVILEMSTNAAEVKPAVVRAVNEFAGRGFRSLGVARADEEGMWQFAGVLPLLDPPRKQAKATIASARQMGVEVKMFIGSSIRANHLCLRRSLSIAPPRLPRGPTNSTRIEVHGESQQDQDWLEAEQETRGDQPSGNKIA